MSQINDAEFDKLGAKGYTGALNDRELAYLQFLGATSDELNDAWVEVIGTVAINDGKLAYFKANGGIGEQLNDVELSYWENLV